MAAIKAAQAAFRALLQLQCIQRFITTGRGVSWHWNTPPPNYTVCPRPWARFALLRPESGVTFMVRLCQAT